MSFKKIEGSQGANLVAFGMVSFTIIFCVCFHWCASLCALASDLLARTA